MKPFFERDGITLYHGDCRAVLPALAPESVDLVLTDPPYDRASAGLYGVAAQEAARLLRPGGAFVCYCGQSSLPLVVAAVAPHLRYWWTLALQLPGQQQTIIGLNVMVTWKPLLLFVKERRGWDGYLRDGLVSPTPDKRHHEWGQSIVPARELVARLSPAGGTVLDPFSGAGTVLRAAKDTGRRAIGIEQEARHCETAVRRLAQLVLPLGA